MALYEKRFRDLMDLKIFVMTDDDIRLSRRIQRDIAERGRTVEDVLAQYNRFVKTSYDEFIKPVMKYADIIIPHGRSNTVAIDFVVENLKTKVPMDNL
jgi:uridine kinase